MTREYATDDWTWKYYIREDGNTVLQCYGPERIVQCFVYAEADDEVTWGPTGTY